MPQDKGFITSATPADTEIFDPDSDEEDIKHISNPPQKNNPKKKHTSSERVLKITKTSYLPATCFTVPTTYFTIYILPRCPYLNTSNYGTALQLWHIIIPFNSAEWSAVCPSAPNDQFRHVLYAWNLQVRVEQDAKVRSG